MKLVERPEPQAAINDVIVEIHASGFVGTEVTWPSTWTDRVGRNRTPTIPGHELAGVVISLGYGTTDDCGRTSEPLRRWVMQLPRSIQPSDTRGRR